MRGKRCSNDLFAVVCKVYDETKSKRAVAKRLGINRRTIDHLLNRRIGDTLTQVTTPLGRPKLTADSSFSTTVKLHRFETNQAIGDRLGLSERQVRYRLPAAGLEQHPAHKCKLDSRDKRRRLKWCQVNRNTDFSKWIFSDECAFELADCSAPRRALVHRKRGEKYAECCVVSAVSKSRKVVQIWGCVTANGNSRFAFLDGTMDEDKYRAILEEHLLDLLDEMPLASRDQVVFQQDGARVHTTVRLCAFFGENDISVADWAPYSPDLSVIENIWKLLKDAVRKLRPNTVLELRNAISECWPKVVTGERCRALFATMQSKMKTVGKKRGML